MSAWDNKWPAPAKINLMLKIIGQREDGYHLLQTVFQLVDWCDWLVFQPHHERRVGLVSPLAGVAEADDLTVRAATLLQQTSGYQQGVLIAVEKNLPMGGGLGGGSSDAATTLVVLNKLWKLGLSVATLMKLGLQLGADVPVFVLGHAAWAEGVGEQLTKINTPEKWLLIINPGCQVDTRAVFSARGLTRDSKSIKMSGWLNQQCTNDCLAVVCKLYPPVAAALSDLAVFAEARLTGTGACVFAQFDSKESAQKAYKSLQQRWQVYLTKGLNRSPLLDTLEC